MKLQQNPKTSPVSRHSRLSSLAEPPLLFEAFFADLSATLINLSATETKLLFEFILRRIANFFGLEQITIGELCPDQHRIVPTHSYSVSTITPAHVFNEEFPWWLEQVRRGVVLRAARLPDDFPSEARKERRL